MPCQTALSAAISASEEVDAVSDEPPYRSDSSWLVVESEASASACSIAELPVLAADVLDALVPVDAAESLEALDADEELEPAEAAGLLDAAEAL